MNKYCKYACLCLGVILYTLKSNSQSLPISSYGTWDRGGKITDFSDPKVDFVKGIEATAKWEDIELVKGTFDFSSFQSSIDKAYDNNVLIRFSVEVGPDSPLWMYDNDTNPNNNPYPQIQKVTTSGGNDKDGWPFYPEYLSQTYQDYLWIFLNQFSDFLRSQPQEKFNLIAFVQVKTGCTGDEVPYKGNVDNLIYDISDKKWFDFRLTMFQKYKEFFNDVPDKKIVLSFNDIDPGDPNEEYAWTWITTQIDPAIGFGIKGGAFNRGHHLSAEKNYKESLYKYLVNPKLPIKTFSASEMDGTTQSEYFQICEDMSYYWAALGGINVGLSTTNLNRVAMDYAINSPIGTETFRMFTRYAQQVYPETATTAFSIFHDGLNSADKVRFPESKYGKSTMDNQDRYVAICNDPIYKNRGARMDHVFAATKGQVYQRGQQLGLNDAGWNIAEGNIERFFTQINPNETSIGLFRVRGEITSTSSKYDRFARSFENATAKNTMYFKFDEDVFLNSTPKSLQFKIIWLDKTVGSKWSFRYTSPTGSKEAILVTGTGGNTWKEVNFTITDAVVDGSGIFGSDFTLVNTDTLDDIFNGIEVGIERGTLSVSSNEIVPADFVSFFKQNEFNVTMNFKTNSKGNIKLYTINGSLIFSEDIEVKAGNTIFSKTLAVASGIYIAVVTTEGKSGSQKLIKN